MERDRVLFLRHRQVEEKGKRRADRATWHALGQTVQSIVRGRQGGCLYDSAVFWQREDDDVGPPG